MAATLDQTRPDQTRPDQTRPDRNSVLKSLCDFSRKLSSNFIHSLRKKLKKIDRIKWLSSCLRFARVSLWKFERRIFLSLTRNRTRRMIYIARPVYSPNVGFVAYFVRALQMIAYADRKNMIPVVDMKNSLNTYIYKDEIGRVNAWEYYFEQPGGVALEDASAMDNSDSRQHLPSPFSKPNSSIGFYLNYGGELAYWQGICRKYIHFSRALIDRVERGKLKFMNKRVLGVSVRGPDYTTYNVINHPVQPSTAQVISKVREAISNSGFDAVYLATEDKAILAEFEAAFCEILIVPEQEYIGFDSKGRKAITEYSLHRNNDKYLSGLEYLTAKLLLCECAGLITSMSGGALFAMLFAKGFEYFYVFDLGVYQ